MGSSDVTVLFFARVKELTCVPSHVLTLQGEELHLDAFIERLEHMWPSLKEIRGEYTFAVNREYSVGNDVCIKGGDEVALITPVSGG